ncbi:hypothetical protein C7974DRAFT_386347 [Boeremia exigua]|uniref:uncharacterized protein n=1 Tax=Boeremia exigua TaxID=749465 RepID=UPI001E8DE0DD|nr:uncharacterized protein C7974DRAFT_386347 [Boeremia exigua]KAH6642891.1 hypothetical protein C7974DRAFT_386347 [Boeremia exigua]
MTSDSNANVNVWEDDKFWDSVHDDEEFWNRWSANVFEPKLVKPMKKPLTASWNLEISESDVEKLKAGFRPRNMDDKYAWLIEDDNGSISIHIIRHYVHFEEYILHIAPKSSNDDSASAKIHSITWESDMVGPRDDVEKAKERAVLLTRLTLKCDLENAPGTA